MRKMRIVGLLCVLGMVTLMGCQSQGTSSNTQKGIAPLADAGSRIVIIKDFADKNPSLDPPRSHEVYIYLPADYYKSTESYPVIYVHDGDTMFLFPKPGEIDGSCVMLEKAFDQAVASGKVKPAILIGIKPSEVGRNVELTPPVIHPSPRASRFGRSGGIEDYYMFLATQLKPYIDSHYRTKVGPADTGVCGASLGGLAALYMSYHHPETFGLCLCMSGSLWWDEQKIVEDLETDRSAKNKVRYWINVGMDEGDTMWRPAQRAAASFARRGWVEGQDMAFYLDYVGKHEYGQWRAMAPEMFRFILGTEPMQLTGISIRQVHDMGGRPIDLEQVLTDPYITMELMYTGGHRHNAAAPVITSEDPGYISIANDGPVPMLENHGHGATILHGYYKGMSTSLIAVGYAPVPETYPRQALPKAPHRLDVDAPLSSWPELTYSMDMSTPKSPPLEVLAAATQAAATQAATTQPATTDSATPSQTPAIQQVATTQPAATQISDFHPPIPAPECHFGVWEDEKGLYIGVDVVKQQIFYDPKILPWGQDGLELRIDAEPDPLRYRQNGNFSKEMTDYMLIGISPAPDGSLETLYQPERLPVGTKVSCKRTDRGYSLQVMLPTHYLNAAQKKIWSDVRINLTVDGQSGPGAFPWQYWWKPDWRSPENVLGSGTFERTLPPAPEGGPGRRD